MASDILEKQQVERLRKIRRASCWDPLQLQVVDVAGRPEVFSKTVELVINSSSTPGVLFMLNTGELMKSKVDSYWPNFKLMKSVGKVDIIAQIQTSLEVEEFQGKKHLFVLLRETNYSVLPWPRQDQSNCCFPIT